jgi:hypothetical protein
MSKRVLFAVAGFLGLCVSLPAQEMRGLGSVQPGRFTLSPLGLNGAVDARSTPGEGNFFGALNNAWYGPAPLTLADGRLFSFPKAFAWMEATPVGYLPVAALEEPARTAPAAKPAGETGNKALGLLPKLDYAGGEVGLFYGKSNGKFGRDVTAGYIFGEVVEGNTHITVGASYERASGRVPVILAP